MKASAPDLDIFGERIVSHPNEVSSLWPGLDAPRNWGLLKPGLLGPPQLLKPSECGGKGNHFSEEAGEVAVLAALPVPPPGARFCEEHAPEICVQCTSR